MSCFLVDCFPSYGGVTLLASFERVFFLFFLPVTETICPHEIVTVSMIWNSIQRSINLARASWLSVSGDERKSGRAAKKRASAVSPPPAGVFRASLFYPIFPLSAGYARFPAV